MVKRQLTPDRSGNYMYFALANLCACLAARLPGCSTSFNFYWQGIIWRLLRHNFYRHMYVVAQTIIGQDRLVRRIDRFGHVISLDGEMSYD